PSDSSAPLSLGRSAWLRVSPAPLINSGLVFFRSIFSTICRKVVDRRPAQRSNLLPFHFAQVRGIGPSRIFSEWLFFMDGIAAIRLAHVVPANCGADANWPSALFMNYAVGAPHFDPSSELVHRKSLPWQSQHCKLR